MPIRLNLLAEAQAEEELRRRDPVKRAIWGGGLIIGCLLIWSGVLLVKTIATRSTLRAIEARLDTQKNQFQLIIDNEKNLEDTKRKLAALQNLAARRFLWGTALNAIQQSTLDDVPLTYFHAEQAYAVSEEVKSKTNEVGRVTIGKPGYVTEKITFLFSAKDNSATPGDQINKYKSRLTEVPYLGKSTGKSNEITITLKNLSAPTYDSESGKPAMLFSLECRFAERVIK